VLALKGDSAMFGYIQDDKYRKILQKGNVVCFHLGSALETEWMAGIRMDRWRGLARKS